MNKPRDHDKNEMEKSSRGLPLARRNVGNDGGGEFDKGRKLKHTKIMELICKESEG